MRKFLTYIFLYSLLFNTCIGLAQQSKIDSLQILLKTDKEDTNKVNHLCKLIRLCELTGRFDNGLNYGKEAILIASKLGIKKGIVEASINTGNIYFSQGDYINAFKYYKSAQKINDVLGNKQFKANIFGNFGNICFNQSNYPKALEYYLIALKIAEEIGNKNRAAVQLSNIGLIYYIQEDYDRALEYYFKVQKLAEEVGNKQLSASVLGYIGLIYYNKKKYEKALTYDLRTLKLAEGLENKSLQANMLGNIGIIYSEQSNALKLSMKEKIQLQTSALDYCIRGVKINEELGDIEGAATSYGNIGTIYMNQNNFKNAFSYLYRALILCDSIGARKGAQSWYKALGRVYEISTISLPDSIGGKLLRPEQMRLRALYYHKRYISIRDTLFSEENKKQLVRKEMNFEFEKKEAVAKAEQDKKNAVAAADTKRQKTVLLLVSFVLLLVAVVAFIILRSLRITRRQKTLIEEQKNLVEEKQKEILDSIYYARRIQRSLLPTEKYIARLLARYQE